MNRRVAHYALWAVQLLLAVLFGMAGVMKTTQPIADLAAQLVWPGEIPSALVRFIGTSELLGAIGLVLPSALRIQPRLTPAAAAGLLTIMLLAIPFHVVMGHDAAGVVFDAVLAGLAAFVLYGRLKLAPIAPRAGTP
jgi:putative oxidoreductase